VQPQAWLRPPGRFRLLRGVDRAKDQSYVLYVLGQSQLARCRFPVGRMTKAEVRRRAAALGLRTADKPDSQDVCFITASGGREAFLGPRIGLHPGRVVDTSGRLVGSVDSVELVTVGQRRGLGGGGGRRRYAVSVDPGSATVVVGDLDDLLTDTVELTDLSWVDRPPHGRVLAQSSAHGDAVEACVEVRPDGATVRLAAPRRAVAPGQSVVLYRGERVLGGGVAV
jgi:tRNA-specific 2-thiouridylase